MVSSHWNFFKSLLGPSIAGFSYTSRSTERYQVIQLSRYLSVDRCHAIFVNQYKRTQPLAGNVKNYQINQSYQMGQRRDFTAQRESHHILIKQGNTHACNTFPLTISSFLTPPRFGSGSTERELHAICASVSVQKGTDISLKHLITKMFKSTPSNGLLKGVNNL